MAFRDSVKVVTIGIAVGLLAAGAASRLIARTLYGINANDPVTMAAATLLICVVTGAAAMLPARRAAHLDPMVALRHE